MEPADRGRFLRIAAGSGMEAAACLDVLVAKELTIQERITDGKEMLLDIVSMLVGMLNSLENRMAEDSPSYENEENEKE